MHALRTTYIRLQAQSQHLHYSLLSHSNKGYTNASQYYVIFTLISLFYCNSCCYSVMHDRISLVKENFLASFSNLNNSSSSCLSVSIVITIIIITIIIFHCPRFPFSLIPLRFRNYRLKLEIPTSFILFDLNCICKSYMKFGLSFQLMQSS